jgi:hypothetical protein
LIEGDEDEDYEAGRCGGNDSGGTGFNHQRRKVEDEGACCLLSTSVLDTATMTTTGLATTTTQTKRTISKQTETCNSIGSQLLNPVVNKSFSVMEG